MNILEALFGFTDIYQRAQEKRKTRIERKRVLENPVYGRMPQEVEKEEQPIKEVQVQNQEQSEVKELLAKADEILKAYEELQKSLNEHSSSIEEKIHSENVKSYRNVQAALDDMEKKTAKEESLVLMVSSLRTQLKCVTWFSVITLLVLIAYILFNLGVF